MTEANTLTAKERSLIGIGAAIAAGCQSCTSKYIEAARAAGACERSIRLAVETALAERHNATQAMAEWARTAQVKVPDVDEAFRVEKQRNVALIASVAAYVVHSTATLDASLSKARQQGWSITQIGLALELGRNVAKVASEKVDAKAGEGGIGSAATVGSCCDPSTDQLASPAVTQPSCGCGGDRASA